MALPVRRSHDDLDLENFAAPCAYGGHPSPLADPETLERAKSLLLAGRPVADVAAEVGYGRYPSFSHAFLEATGVRPSAFQKAHGVKVKRRHGGFRQESKRPPPDRSDAKPLPRYDSRTRRRKRNAKGS